MITEYLDEGSLFDHLHTKHSKIDEEKIVSEYIFHYIHSQSAWQSIFLSFKFHMKLVVACMLLVNKN